MPTRARHLHLLLVAVFTLVVAWCQWREVPALRRGELAVADWIAQVGRKSDPDPALVFLARDTASANLERADIREHFDLAGADADSLRALELMAHEWPWSREVHALVLDRLVAAGARVVVFDFLFAKPSPNDEPFRLSLDRHRDRVVLVGNFAEDHDRSQVADAHGFIRPSPSLIASAETRDLRIGFDNFGVDLDGVVRTAHYRDVFGWGVWRGDEELSLAARALERAGLAGLIPESFAGRRVRFAGPSGTFMPRSIFEIFVPRYWEQNYGGGAFFRDKIVVIGASGNWQHDEHRTPLGVMPGAELHLNAINAAMHGTFVRELPRSAGALLVLAAAVAAMLIRRAVRQPFWWFAAQGIATAAWIGAALALYDRADLLLPCVAPLFLFHLNGVTSLVFDVLAARREKSHLRRTLERYVSRDVVEELVDHPDEYRQALGGDLRHVTVLFSDIRDFTQKARAMRSQELVRQLNEYFSAMVECVFAHGGTLDKFIGDAVMAVWGSTRRSDPAADARNAVACALAMRTALARLNARWAGEGRPQFRIGIAVNAGEAIVGNIGSPHRMEFTVIGDAVNIAWRLQERTKEHGDAILLGEAVVPLLGAEFPAERCGEFTPAGGEPVGIARLVEVERHAILVAHA